MNDYEKELLTCLMASPKKVDLVIDFLKPKHLANPVMGEIYKAMCDLFVEYDGFTILSLKDRCRKEMPNANLSSTIMDLAMDVLTVNPKFLAEKILSEWRKNQLGLLASNIHEAIDGGSDEKSIIETTEKILDELEETSQQKDPSIKRIMMECMDGIQERAKHKGMQGMNTGFRELNDTLKGFRKKQLVVVAGRPSMGKTCFAVNAMTNVAKEGHTCVMFSIEMEDTSVGDRMIATASGVIGDHIDDSSVASEMETTSIVKGCDTMSQLPIKIYDQVKSYREVKRLCRKEKRQRGLDLVVIDYLQHMDLPKAGSSRESVDIATKGLKHMAKELDICVILVSQLSRSVESRQDKRPMMSDLKESGGIEQDADVVMLMYNDYYYNRDMSETYSEINIAKNRKGKVDNIEMKWEREIQKFSDRDW